MTKLEVLNLSHTFVQNNMRLPVLNNLHFSVGTGQFIALLGPSGCGKSTLFNIISGLLIPQDGAIYLNGNPILGRTGVFGYMQQKDLLLQWRTVLNNVLIGPEIQKEPLEPARKEALKLLTHLGLQGFANSYPMQLSGGMRQRVALVRTLLFRKDILLLDEPFGALDAMTRSVMQSIFLDIWNKGGQTILLITHDIEEALLLADKIYVLTSRPASIKAEIDVSLPRPRCITDTELISLKSDLFETLMVEMQQVFNSD
jgi:ABC-type nitrate/sulfonate/bicarbonate transport system ATPase subunit